jgi:predicted transcriptional regulator
MATIMKDKITDAELQVLKILWDEGPSTVKDVHNKLEKKKPTGYTTTLKIMQIMAQKALLSVDKSQRQHIYHSNIARGKVQRKRLNQLIESTFGGSASSLMMQLLKREETTQDDLDAIKAYINKLDQDDTTA